MTDQEKIDRYFAEERSENYIPLIKCKKGYVYRIHSRNLSFGVFDGKAGFIGIRTKFNDRYLFTEYHWDQGPPHGTVKPMEERGLIPNDVQPVEDFGTVDQVTRRPVAFDKPISDGGRGWFFTDTNEASTAIRPGSDDNVKLFEFLDGFQE
jgi:hypothetical protein